MFIGPGDRVSMEFTVKMNSAEMIESRTHLYTSFRSYLYIFAELETTDVTYWIDIPFKVGWQNYFLKTNIEEPKVSYSDKEPVEPGIFDLSS